MSTEEFKVHTCDRCGKERQQPLGREFPRDWSKLSQQQVQGGALARWDLCDSCSSSFAQWRGQASS